ncbi:hypothetical protein SUDANB70_02469 [Streptomyces sp. enrichment culture]
MNSRRAALTCAILWCSTLAACTERGGSDEPGPPSPLPSASTVAPPPQEALTAPEVEPGFEEILSEGPHRGVRPFGTIGLPKGESWIKVNCISRSKSVNLELSLEKIGGFSVGCSGVSVEKTAHQLNLEAARRLHFTVNTEDSVRWYVSIQAPAR